MTRLRALVDWDHGADGIWRVGRSGGAVAWRGWADLLSPDLVAALQVWNDQAAQVIHHGASEAEVRALAAGLARRAQDELGDGWDVLYSLGSPWAWRWVEPPWRRRSSTPDEG